MPRRSQLDRSRSTKADLVATGRRLFAERGYAGAAAEDIVAAAGVTRGALYHHFGDKRGLFVAVLEELESEITAELTTSVGAVVAELGDDAEARTATLRAGIIRSLDRYLEICVRPEILRIALIDAPTVLGWQSWRELEARHGLGLVIGIVALAAESGSIAGEDVSLIAQLLFSSIIEAGLFVAHAEDHVAARAEAMRALLVLLSSILPG
jgi:AcrR family transcriptional regulator